MEEKTKKENLLKRIIPPNLIIPVAISGILIVLISTFLEYRSRKQDYEKILENQAVLFVKTLGNTSEKVYKAAEAVETEITNYLLSQLKLINIHDQSEKLNMNVLEKLIDTAGFDEIQIYDSEGKTDIYSSRGSANPGIIPSNVIKSFLIKGQNELIYLIADTLNMKDDRIALIIPRERGGIFAGIIKLESIQSFRNYFGFGYFLKSLHSGEGLEYIVLENPYTIIAGSFEGFTISSFSEDNFLSEVLSENTIKARTLNYGEKSIYEVAVPFNPGIETAAVLRMGFSLSKYELLNAHANRRLFILVGVFIIVGIVLLNFGLTYRHRQLLKIDLDNLRNYTNIILENLASGVLTVRKNGKIQVVNKFASDILEKEYKTLFNKSYFELPEQFQKIVEKTLKQKSEINKPQKQWFYINGNSRLLSIKSTTLKLENDEDTCILLIDDITEQAKLEEQIQRNEKLTAMKKLSSAVAHEIRNPLSSIQLIIDYLKKKYKPSENLDKYNSFMETLGKEISRISNIVEEFLKYARPPKINLSAMNFSEFFSDIRTLYRGKLEKSNINITFNLEDHPEFRGDYEKLKQVFINLIENAADAITPPGKISITGRISGESGESYEISIEDTGCGISENETKQIFDLYYTTKKKGSGIGLAVVEQIISQHSGTINVQSRTGKGTKFILKLPLNLVNI